MKEIIKMGFIVLLVAVAVNLTGLPFWVKYPLWIVGSLWTLRLIPTQSQLSGSGEKEKCKCGCHIDSPNK